MISLSQGETDCCLPGSPCTQPRQPGILLSCPSESRTQGQKSVSTSAKKKTKKKLPSTEIWQSGTSSSTLKLLSQSQRSMAAQVISLGPRRSSGEQMGVFKARGADCQNVPRKTRVLFVLKGLQHDKVLGLGKGAGTASCPSLPSLPVVPASSPGIQGPPVFAQHMETPAGVIKSSAKKVDSAISGFNVGLLRDLAAVPSVSDDQCGSGAKSSSQKGGEPRPLWFHIAATLCPPVEKASFI